MKTTYYFQINPDHNRQSWENVQPVTEAFDERDEAIKHAQELADKHVAEVRWTDNANWNYANGAYTSHKTK